MCIPNLYKTKVKRSLSCGHCTLPPINKSCYGEAQTFVAHHDCNSEVALSYIKQNRLVKAGEGTPGYHAERPRESSESCWRWS